MGIEKYFNLDVDSKLLYGDASKVIMGKHGVSINSHGEHFATAYHIYTGKGIVIAKPELRNFLLGKFPGSSDLTNEYKRTNSIEEEVQYEGQNYSLKKIKLEWIAELFEKETTVYNVLSEPSNIPLSKLNIEQEIIPLLDKISNSVVFEDNNNSHRNMINGIFDLIKNNHNEFEILALVYFPILFEKTCNFFMNNSEVFKDNCEKYNSIRNEKDSSYRVKELTAYHYLGVLKLNKINFSLFSQTKTSIEFFRDSKQKSIIKKFDDLYYFIDLRNRLIHKDFKEQESFDIINDSKKMLAFILDIIEEYGEE
jgi:hypothetical protein